jgi:hypothetical protein
MNKTFFVFFLLFFLVLFPFFFIKNVAEAPEKASSLFINGKEIRIEYANTEEKRIRGLSGKISIPEDFGLLFTFPKEGVYGFWMKDMNFPIDIIWIGKDLRVKDITKNISPETFPNTFKPKVPILYVLEVNAGFSDQYKISEGMNVN